MKSRSTTYLNSSLSHIIVQLEQQVLGLILHNRVAQKLRQRWGKVFGGIIFVYKNIYFEVRLIKYLYKTIDT